MPRELYNLLGVPRDADSEDIRRAYLIRMRVVHPDRFNRARQPAEWLQANDMLRELNEAYEILSDPTMRDRYDASIGQAGSARRQRSPEADEPKGADYNSSGDSAPNRNGGAVGEFVHLCRDIRLTCWQQIQRGSGDRAARLLVLDAAYADYERRVSPWLSVILENYQSNTPVITRVRNAAAGCLSSLAGGFIGVDDLKSAQALVIKALPLVFDDIRLEAELTAQLDYVTAEKQKSAPKRGHEKGESADAGRPSVVFDPNVSPRFAGIVNAQLFRYSAGLLCAIAVFAALLFLNNINTRRPSALTQLPEQSLAQPVPAPDDFKRLTLDRQLEVLLHASAQEREVLTPIFNERYGRDIDKVPEGERDLFFRNLAAAGLLETHGAVPSRVQLSHEPPIPAPSRSDSPSPASHDAVVQAGPARKTRERFTIPMDGAPGTAVPIQHEPVSLPNGTNLIPPPANKGLGQLEISNHSNRDAVVKLKTAVRKATLLVVYVKAMSDVSVPRIPAGNYILEFASGRDWDETKRSFRQDRAFGMFEESFNFSEIPGPDNIKYSVNSVTLHAVPNGNARTEAISGNEFADDLGVGGQRHD